MVKHVHNILIASLICIPGLLNANIVKVTNETGLKIDISYGVMTKPEWATHKNHLQRERKSAVIRPGETHPIDTKFALETFGAGLVNNPNVRVRELNPTVHQDYRIVQEGDRLKIKYK
jgi:hypothetical protein